MAHVSPQSSAAGLPSVGVGLKPAHYRDALTCSAPGFWVEVHPENYMTPGGPRHAWLTAMRRSHPVSMHGVGLSLGGPDRPDAGHLGALLNLVGRYEPFLVSEHLAWSAYQGEHFGDLLPFPYTRAALDRFCDHVDEVQEALGRKILIENPALYVALRSEVGEPEFLAELVRRTGCGLLLDVNNVHVTAANLGRDPHRYIAALPADAVEEIHVAGHAPDEAGTGLLIDNHGAPVSGAVWRLYAHALKHTGPVPTLIERDTALPPFAELMAERDRAEAILQSHAVRELSEARNV
jgi:uncharacterized protein (UPF0276 family)